MNKKSVLVIGLISYAILITLSVYYYKQRVVMMDTSFQLFQVLQKNSFAIQAYRFGAVFTQIFPLVASWLGLSMKAVAISYSIGFEVFYAVCFFIILLWFKNERMAMSLLFFDTIMVAHSFFWIQCELIQGVAFTLVYLAMIEHEFRKENLSFSFVFLSPFMIITIIFFYPLLAFVLLFGIIYLWLVYEKKKTKTLLVIIAAYLVLFVLKSLFFNSAYDDAATSRIKNIIKIFPHYIGMQSNKNFIKYCIDDYYLVPALLLINTIILLIQRKYQQLFAMLIFFFGFLFVVNVSYPDGSDQFYVEPQYTILSFMVAVPFFYSVLPWIKRIQLRYALVSAILILGLVKIKNTAKIYTERLHWYQDFADSTNKLAEKKLILTAGKAPIDKLKLVWGAPTEFWLLSTIETGESRSVNIEENPGEFDKYLSNNKIFIGKWSTISYDELTNKKYFNFTDTSYYHKY